MGTERKGFVGRWKNDAGEFEILDTGISERKPVDEGGLPRLWIPATPTPKRGGGPKTRYDYEGMIIHLAALCFNDPKYKAPTQEELIEAGRKWLDGTDPDHVVDKREIQNRVARFMREVLGD